MKLLKSTEDVIVPTVEVGDVVEILYASGIKGKLGLVLFASDVHSWIKIFDFEKQVERVVIPYFKRSNGGGGEVVVTYKKVC
jgi:hypothetical protein